MTKHELAALLSSITPPDATAAHQFSERREHIVEQVDDLLLSRPDLDVLIGAFNRPQMHRNHRNHGLFMAALFADYDADRLLATMLWVLPAYQAHGFRPDYWDVQLAAWQKTLAEVLDPDIWQQIAPIYAWMRDHLDTINALGLAELT